MVYRIYLLTVVIALALCAPVHAGSIFSANGVGEQLQGGGAKAQGLGGGGIGLADSLTFNSMNPALSAFVPRTTFRGGGEVEFWNTDSQGRAASDADFVWQDLALYVPLSSRWKLGFGAQPLREMDIKTFEPRRATFPGDTVSYEARNVWRGSDVELRLDNGFIVSDKLKLGLSAVYTLQRIERQQILDLPQSEGHVYYYNAQYNQVETFHGWSAIVGGYYQVSPRIGVGAALRPPVPGIWKYEFSKPGADSSLTSERHGNCPGDYRLGAAYRLGKRWIGVADVEYGQWARQDMGIFIADSLHSPAPVNPMFVSLGMEREAGRTPLFTGTQLWSYRGAVFYRRHYWPEINGEAVEDVGATAGLTVPIAGGDGRLLFAGEGGLRGFDKAKLGAQEVFVRFSMQLVMTENWFQRRKPRLPQ